MSFRNKAIKNSPRRFRQAASLAVSILWMILSGVSGAQTFKFCPDSSRAPSLSVGSGNIFVPCLVREIRSIRTFIKNKYFDSLRVKYGDLQAVDAIYLRSLVIAEYDIRKALFLSLMAVLEHRTIDLKMPLVRYVPLPLTFETKSEFHARVKHVPKTLYSDSPNSKEGDRDKPQHFFASAFLAYTSNAPDYIQMLGDAVEWAEPILVIGGADDPRDRRANDQGMLFGRDLISDNILLPSDYLTLPYQDRK
jgi:hypothetical protein